MIFRSGFLHSPALVFWAVLAVGCAETSPKGMGALEPVESTASQTGGTGSEASSASPALDRLLELLRGLGYDGVGLEFESESTLELLHRVFSDPGARGRRLKLIYTGGQLSYDARAESLTIGGTTDVAVILAFIQKQVPKRP